MNTQISTKIMDEDKKLILEASRKVGLGLSGFIRQATLTQARKVLNENRTN